MHCLTQYGTQAEGLGGACASQIEVQTGLLSFSHGERKPLKEGGEEEEQLHPGQLLPETHALS